MIPSCFTLDWAGWDVDHNHPTRICRRLVNGKEAIVTHYPGEEDPYWLRLGSVIERPSMAYGPESFVYETINAYAERNGGWANA